MPASKSKSVLRAFVLLGLALPMVGCKMTKVTRGSDDASVNDAALSRGLDLKDVDLALKVLLANFQASDFVAEKKAAGNKPGLAIMNILNETDQYSVDTTNLRATFEEMVFGVGGFSIVSASATGKLKSLLAEQNSDWYEGGSVPEAGNLLGFTFVIGGLLKGETEKGSGVARTQYRLYMKAMDVSTGELLWLKSADITKSQG